MKNTATIRIKLLLGLLSCSIRTQLPDVHAQNKKVTLPDWKRVGVDNNAPFSHSYIIDNGKLKTLQMEYPRKVIEVKVTLKDKPLALHKKKNGLPDIGRVLPAFPSAMPADDPRISFAPLSRVS